MQEDQYLMLSGLQHYIFCPRQYALIHIEQQWEENWRTVDGQLMHRRADDPEKSELRGDVLTLRALNVKSDQLGIVGKCDVVEFHRDDNGIALHGRKGKWIPYPVEYKRGNVKDTLADELQLVAQAMCLEEMLLCPVQEGALFYGEAKRRHVVKITDDLKNQVKRNVAEMHKLMDRGYTPKPTYKKSCNACSLINICLPKAQGSPVAEYLDRYINEK